MPSSNQMSATKKRRRFMLGIIVLLVVDIIWVASAELSEYIFHEGSFDKPYFTTYFKTSLFTLYLVGFLFVRRWQFQCMNYYNNKRESNKLLQEVERVSTKEAHSNSLLVSANVSGTSTPVPFEENLSAPRYENMTDDDASSIGEIDKEKQRKVSFSHVREVRSLSQKHNDAQILARMSQNSIEQLRNVLITFNRKLSLEETVKLSMMFVFLWVFATLMYQEALSKTSAAVTNILSSTSGIFTLVLAALFPSSVADKFTISKLVAVLISFAGVCIVCWTDPSREGTSLNVGEIYALLGAILYACYLVLIRKKVGEDEDLDIPLFFGFVGLFGLICFWPGFLLLHYTGQETFELPQTYTMWGYLAANAIIGTILSELLWLWGCFLTSSLMATLSLVLVTPLSMLWDMFVNRIEFSWLFLTGIIPVFLSYIAVCLLTHYSEWDPVQDVFQKICSCRNNMAKEEHTGLLYESDDSSQVETGNNENI